jgi:hypothetical protein
MNTNFRDREEDFVAREIRACIVCGANFSATRDSEFCPICMLRVISQHQHAALPREKLQNIIVLLSWFLAGPSTGRVAVGTPPQQMNLLTLLSLGLEIPIHGLERRGRKAKD